jgi:hypothetical protein
MEKLDDLISEIQTVYVDIYSNRRLSITDGLEVTPASGLINAVIENDLELDKVIRE